MGARAEPAVSPALRAPRRLEPEWLYFLAMGIWVVMRTVPLTVFHDLMTDGLFKVLSYLTLLLLVAFEVAYGIRELRRCQSSRDASTAGPVEWAVPDTRDDRRAARRADFSALLETTYAKVTVIAIPIVVALFLILKVNNNGRFPQYVLLFVFCARNIDFRRVARFGLVMSVAILAVMVALCVLGVAEDFIVTYPDPRPRHCLGFLWPLYPGMLVFNITALTLYLGGMRESKRTTGALFALNLVILWLCSPRLSTMLALLMIALCVSLRFDAFARLVRRASPLLVWSFVIIGALCIVLAFAYDYYPDALAEANGVFGSRIRYGNEAITTYGITPFGQTVEMRGYGKALGTGTDLEEIEASYFYIDSTYIQYLVRQGVVALVALVGAYTVTAHEARRSGDWTLLLILTILAMHLAIDDLTTRLQFNTMILETGGAVSSVAGRLVERYWPSARERA